MGSTDTAASCINFTDNVTCPHCKLLCNSQKKLLKHVADVHNRVFCDFCHLCTLCCSGTYSDIDLEMHMFFDHGLTTYKCMLCFTVAHSIDEIVEHFSEIHTDLGGATLYKLIKFVKQPLSIKFIKNLKAMGLNCNPKNFEELSTAVYNCSIAISTDQDSGAMIMESQQKVYTLPTIAIKTEPFIASIDGIVSAPEITEPRLNCQNIDSSTGSLEEICEDHDRFSSKTASETIYIKNEASAIEVPDLSISRQSITEKESTKASCSKAPKSKSVINTNTVTVDKCLHLSEASESSTSAQNTASAARVTLCVNMMNDEVIKSSPLELRENSMTLHSLSLQDRKRKPLPLHKHSSNLAKLSESNINSDITEAEQPIPKHNKGVVHPSDVNSPIKGKTITSNLNSLKEFPTDGSKSLSKVELLDLLQRIAELHIQQNFVGKKINLIHLKMDNMQKVIEDAVLMLRALCAKNWIITADTECCSQSPKFQDTADHSSVQCGMRTATLQEALDYQEQHEQSMLYRQHVSADTPDEDLQLPAEAGAATHQDTLAGGVKAAQHDKIHATLQEDLEYQEQHELSMLYQQHEQSMYQQHVPVDTPDEDVQLPMEADAASHQDMQTGSVACLQKSMVWTSEGTSALLGQVQQHYETLKDPITRKKPLWKKIAMNISEYVPGVTNEQAVQKWKNLVRAVKKFKASKYDTNRVKRLREPLFLQEVLAIIGDDHRRRSSSSIGCSDESRDQNTGEQVAEEAPSEQCPPKRIKLELKCVSVQQKMNEHPS